MCSGSGIVVSAMVVSVVSSGTESVSVLVLVVVVVVVVVVLFVLEEQEAAQSRHNRQPSIKKILLIVYPHFIKVIVLYHTHRLFALYQAFLLKFPNTSFTFAKLAKVSG